jgi:hypothetical protein
MFRKLIHHRPFFRKPPFEDPRELGERYPKEPILEDYWIKPYILEALKNYPRLNDSCVVEGLWTFANSILLKNYKAVKRVPPTFDDPEVTHKIAFLDKEDVELGAIKFWRKVDSTFGIDVKLGSGGISIVGDNDNPTMSLVNTPVNGAPKEIVNVEYLNQAFSTFNDGLGALANRVQALEDLYDNYVKPIIIDPNNNQRNIHTTIHADASDNNLPTCGAVYQYGKDISDALNTRIGNLPSVVDSVQDGDMHPVTSNAVADELSDIRGTLSSLGSRISSIANDVASLQSAINNSGGGSSGGSGGGSNDSYIFAYPSGTVEGGDMPTPEIINAWDIVTGNHIASAVTVSTFGGGNHPEIVTYTIDQNSSLDSNTFVAGYWENEAVYTPANLSNSDSYRCIVAPTVTQGSGAGGAGDTRPWVRVKAGVFQRIGGGSGSTIQAIWYNDSITPHTTFSSTVGNTYPGSSLYLPNGDLPNGTSIGGSGEYICVTASSYYVGDIDSSGPHFGSITIGTFRKIE